MNPPNGQSPLDYLNQISSDTKKTSVFNFGLNPKTFILVGAILVVLVLIVAVVLNTTGSSSKRSWQQLSLRLDATSTLVDKAGPLIKNSQLKSLNSELKLYLSNTKRDLNGQLTVLSIKVSEAPQSLIEKESSSAIANRLEDGRLNARYDATYSREMSYYLATTLALYQQLMSSGDTTSKEFIQNSYDNLVPIQQAIEDFSSITE